MRLSCPACGSMISLDAAIGHEAARDAVMIALRLPAPLGKLLIQYVALFRPRSRALSFDRLASLLGELVPLIESAQVERNGRVWAAPQESWRAALEEMLAKRDKLTLPLKSHGYLLEIVAGIGGKSEAAAEQKREEQRAYPYREPRQQRAQPETIRAALDQAKQLITRRGSHDDNS